MRAPKPHEKLKTELYEFQLLAPCHFFKNILEDFVLKGTLLLGSYVLRWKKTQGQSGSPFCYENRLFQEKPKTTISLITYLIGGENPTILEPFRITDLNNPSESVLSSVSADLIYFKIW